MDELLGGFLPERDSTYDRAVEFLKAELSGNPIPATELYEKAAAQGIGERTLRTAKGALGIGSFKKDKKWFWSCPSSEKAYENSSLF